MTDPMFGPSAVSRSTVGGSRFPPIADYGFISDCEVCALVAPGGSVEWMCLPRMDSPSIFAAVLDRHAGWFRLGPADVTVPADRRYLAGTMVLETTWDTPTGRAVVRDVLLIGPWRDDRPRSSAHRRAPTDHQAERVLLRTARCLSGSIELVLECQPAFDYGRRRGVWRHPGDAYGQAEIGPDDGEPPIRLTTDLRLGLEGPQAVARRRLQAGEHVYCALSWGDGSPPETFADAHERLAYTADFWHDWIGRGRFPDHPWRTYLQRSALTLKGLISAPTGAMLAAATASLPETPGGERNYDVLLDSVHLYIRSGDQLDERRWPTLVRQVDTALARWQGPDQGLWEVRGPPQQFTASKVLCWVAADRGAKLAELWGERGTAARWRKAADEIHADVSANGTDDRAVFCQHYDTTALDASALLIPLLGFLPPEDPRVRSTVLAIADEFTEDELVLRYRVEETDDGFSGEEGTFTICSFWLVSALAKIGEVARARALCTKLLAYASPLHLSAEEIDPHSGLHLGNFPQAFTHLALINAVMHLIHKDERLSDDAAGLRRAWPHRRMR